MTATLPLRTLDATKDLAKAIAPLLAKGDMLALWGELGTGKTEFARALLKALGAQGDVPSPTFTLVQTYEIGDVQVFHFDLYRVMSELELDELGWEEAIADGIVLVEWPGRAGKRLPRDRLNLYFTLSPEGERNCRIEKSGTWRDRQA